MSSQYTYNSLNEKTLSNERKSKNSINSTKKLKKKKSSLKSQKSTSQKNSKSKKSIKSKKSNLSSKKSNSKPSNKTVSKTSIKDKNKENENAEEGEGEGEEELQDGKIKKKSSKTLSEVTTYSTMPNSSLNETTKNLENQTTDELMLMNNTSVSSKENSEK
jgi:hypothetical protein